MNPEAWSSIPAQTTSWFVLCTPARVQLSSTTLVKSQLLCLRSVGIFNHVMLFIHLFLFLSIYVPQCETTGFPLSNCATRTKSILLTVGLSYAAVLFISKLRQTSDGPSLSLLLANLALVPSLANEWLFCSPSKKAGNSINVIYTTKKPRYCMFTACRFLLRNCISQHQRLKYILLANT